MTLTRRLVAVTFVVLAVGAVAMGVWLDRAAEKRVLQQEGEQYALYVSSALGDDLRSMQSGNLPSDRGMLALDRLLDGTALGARLSSLKVWSSDGRILYGMDLTQIGARPAPNPSVAAAFRGETLARRIAPGSDEQRSKGARGSEVVEIFAPVRDAKTGSILAVSEIRLAADVLGGTVAAARLQSWISVISTCAVMFTLLALQIRRATRAVIASQQELQNSVSALAATLAESEQLRERVARAAGRTTSLNERFLNRLSADLHDGPGQGLSLAVMRLGALAEACGSCQRAVGANSTVAAEFRRLQAALDSSMRDMRAISKGLHLPDLDGRGLAEIARRAASDFERSSGAVVRLTVDDVPEDAPLPVKIALFRLLQESLANGLRHGHAANQQIILSASEGQLRIVVRDDGDGFDPQVSHADGHLGLQGMRERVEMLGGTFLVSSAAGKGTVVRADLPLTSATMEDE